MTDRIRKEELGVLGEKVRKKRKKGELRI